MLILGTNVISATRRPERAPQVMAWLRAQPDDQLYVSAISWGEIERGIARQERIDPPFATDLRRWVATAATLFADRILPFEEADAIRWGRLWDRLGHNGPDVMIAATALRHGCPVVTRNVSDFAPAGVTGINPFDP